jgi:hypothetical protein
MVVRGKVLVVGKGGMGVGGGEGLMWQGLAWGAVGRFCRYELCSIIFFIAFVTSTRYLSTYDCLFPANAYPSYF